jgi:hypothetical protein
VILPSRQHDADEPGLIMDQDADFPWLRVDPNQRWQEEWRFDLSQENAKEIRGYLQFGGRLSVNGHFLPRAKTVCEERNLTLVLVEGFKASIDLGNDRYIVSGLVTLQGNPQQNERNQS